MIRSLLFILFSGICFVVFAQSKPKEHIAFINGKAHLGDGQVIEHCLFVINKDRIESVADQTGIKLNPAAFDTVIDLGGLHIYPALINANNVLGLHDAEAVRAANDQRETGTLNPHVRALIAYNTDNQIIPTVRANGVLYTQVTPRGGLISGSSSIMALDGWNWEDAVLRRDDGIHLNFPALPSLRPGEKEEDFKKREERYRSDIVALQRFFGESLAYLEGEVPQEKNLRFEAMRGALKGNARLYLHAEKARDLLSAIDFATRFKVPYPVLVGARESHKIIKTLKISGIPVMLFRVNELPELQEDDVDLQYKLPSLLARDSILFCLQLEGDMEAMNSRNLPYQAGHAAAYGLDKEMALSSISLNVAKIMGIEKEIGSLKEGKLASFVISSGDLLDMKESNVNAVYLNGRVLDTDNKQSQLHRKYLNKYKLK